MSAFDKAWNLLKNDPKLPTTPYHFEDLPTTPYIPPEDTKPTAPSPYAPANYPKTPQQRQTPCPSCGGSGFVMQTAPNSSLTPHSYGPKDLQSYRYQPLNYGGQQP